jgi:hypothetical protein
MVTMAETRPGALERAELDGEREREREREREMGSFQRKLPISILYIYI